jgi:hypothetical protein
MSVVSVLCCQIEVSATSLSLAQRSPIGCVCVCVCVCLCVIEKLQQCCDVGRSLAVLPGGFRREQSVNAFKTVKVKMNIYAYITVKVKSLGGGCWVPVL